MDKRHKLRTSVVQALFASTFRSGTYETPESISLHDDVVKNETKIDEFIKTGAPKFPLDQISRVDLAILRLAVYELVVHPVEPQKVVINEAIELAKELGGEKSYRFVNAVLGTVVKSL